MTLKQAINEAISLGGWSINSLANVSGVAQSSLHRFCKGEQGLRYDSLQRVIDCLNIHITTHQN